MLGVVIVLLGTLGLQVPTIRVDEFVFGTEHNEVTTFGVNSQGQLGLGNRLFWEQVSSPSLTTVLKQDKVKHLVTGCDASHVVAVTVRGQLIGWGGNDLGQLGVTPSTFVAPRLVVASDEFVTLAAVSSTHTIALTRKNALVRLIGGQQQTIAHPHLAVVSIAAGAGFSLLASEDGRVFLLGNGDENLSPVPIQQFAVSVSACAAQSFVLTSSGIWSWGDNTNGQLCSPIDLQQASSSNPTPISSETEFGTVTSIRPGPLGTLALTDEGALLSCSFSGFKKFPITSTEHRVVSYAIGRTHALAILASGDVYGWGHTDKGQLARFDDDQLLSRPVKLAFDGVYRRKHVEVAAGNEFSVLLSACDNQACIHGVAIPADNCQCVCEPMWTGKECSICNRGNDHCSNHGAIEHNTCQCNCSAGFGGSQCDVCDLACDHGKAIVVNETCVCGCARRWTGEKCDKCALTSNDCFQGTLDQDACRCACKKPWGGEKCDVCSLSGSSCVHGSLDPDRCQCQCDGDWTGQFCDQCALGQNAPAVHCFTVELWNSDGSGWDNHNLIFTPLSDPSNSTSVTLAQPLTFSEQTLCLPAGLYNVHACGTSQVSGGWSALGVIGHSANSCDDHDTVTVLVQSPGCNMGKPNMATCQCECDGHWKGQRGCYDIDVQLIEVTEGEWADSQVIFEDSDHQITHHIAGLPGARHVCLPLDKYLVYVCHSGPQPLNTSRVQTQVAWEIAFDSHVITQQMGTGMMCDTARLSALSFDLGVALDANNQLDRADRALTNLGVNMTRPDHPQLRQFKGYCDRCDVINKCVHGTFQSECECKCNDHWIGDRCDLCGHDMTKLNKNQVRLDHARCELHCVGGWSGAQCDHCALLPEHCDGIVEASTCTCKPVVVSAETTTAAIPPPTAAIPPPTATTTPAGTSDTAVGEREATATRTVQCVSPWTGPDCSICPRVASFCRHNGTLTDCQCDCHVPWMGDDCSVCAIQEQSCQHGHKLASQSECGCQCSGGWHGMFCSECDVHCDHGRVNDKCECECEHEWSGPTCNVCGVSTSTCSSHGSIDAASCRCLCDGRWSGQHCDECVDLECSKNGFGNMDTCACDCDLPWTGQTCSECGLGASDCVHGALNSSCQCACGNSWTGEFCQDCGIGEHDCVHGVFESEICKCLCPANRSGQFCQVCDLTAAQCGGVVNMEHCQCNTVTELFQQAQARSRALQPV